MRAARHQSFASRLNSARIAGPPGDQALQGLEHLPGKLLLQFVDLLRVGKEVLVSVPGEIALDLHGLAERARAFEPFDIGASLLKRSPGVVAVGIGDGSQADRSSVRRFGRAD